MKRGVATITVYVYGETDEDLIKQGKEIAEGINLIYDGRAEMETLHQATSGKIGRQEQIKFKK